LKNDITINNSWRNFKSPDEREQPNPNVKYSLRINDNSDSNSDTKPVKLSGSFVHKRTKGAILPPSASKFHHNQNLIDTKFKQQSTVNSLEQKAMYNEASSSEWRALEKSLTNKELNKLSDFTGDVDMSRNLKPATTHKFDLDIRGTRRMSIDFARIISKIAEDNSGSIIEGSDFWDVNKLISRVIDNRNILHCKSSRELESVVLILDSSPSCESYAQLYSELAVTASNFDDVDMYNAPNARITHRYDKKQKDFTVCMSFDDIINDAHRWKYFKNRVIMFFGDFDGTRVVLDNTYNNKVYWFCTESEDYIEDELNCRNYNSANLTVFPNVRNAKGFINAMKIIR